MAKFAKEIMVDSLIDSFDGEMRKYLSDSHGIFLSLHKFGLSGKYLSLVCRRSKEKHAKHVEIVVERTILVRSLKFIFRRALRESPTYLHKVVVKNMLNCLFSEEATIGKHS